MFTLVAPRRRKEVAQRRHLDESDGHQVCRHRALLQLVARRVQGRVVPLDMAIEALALRERQGAPFNVTFNPRRRLQRQL